MKTSAAAEGRGVCVPYTGGVVPTAHTAGVVNLLAVGLAVAAKAGAICAGAHSARVEDVSVRVTLLPSKNIARTCGCGAIRSLRTGGAGGSSCPAVRPCGAWRTRGHSCGRPYAIHIVPGLAGNAACRRRIDEIADAARLGGCRWQSEPYKLIRALMKACPESGNIAGARLTNYESGAHEHGHGASRHLPCNGAAVPTR
jgi:hypothetical protein